jgi:hypothetical protein
MIAIGVTGPRRLTQQAEQVRKELRQLQQNNRCAIWHIGDAAGVDAIAYELVLTELGNLRELHLKNPQLPQKAQGAERSTRMVKALAAAGGTLHAFPNKPCPLGLKPSRSWKSAGGSGTWGTIALATGLGVPLVLHPLTPDATAPDWMKETQLTLL